MKQKMTGQGLVEYALVLVLVAIAVIALLALLGDTIQEIFSQIADPLSNSVPLSDGSPSDGSLEAYLEFQELSIYQEEMLGEATLLFEEGAWEIVDVFIEYAVEIGNQVLYDLIYTVQQEIESGNYTNLFSLFSTITSDYGEIPQAVRVAVILKAEPLLIDSYIALEDTQVPFESYQAAIQDLEGLVGADDAILLLGEIWELVDQRNTFIQEARPTIALAACQGISSLYETGVQIYITLANQFQAQIPPCDS